MSLYAGAVRLAGAAALLAAGSLGPAAAQELSAGKALASALSLSAGADGLGFSSDLRGTLGAVTGDDDADWLTRVRGGYDYHGNGDSRFWAETIQPFAQFGPNTVFWQARIATAHDDGTLNAGLGYRWLGASGNLMLGVNTFYDRSFDAGHQRVSIGGEAIGQFFSVHANVYQSVSGWKDLGGGVTERALDGADASIDTQAPYMPWLRIGARYFLWDATTTDDAEGLQGTLSADITDQLQIVSTYAGDDDPQGDYFFGVRLRLKSGHDTPTAMKDFWTANIMDARDLSKRTLDFVERDNRIVTESQGGPYASGTITISRSE